MQAHVPHLFEDANARTFTKAEGEVGVPTGSAFAPALATGGRMQGTVYTIPGSGWHDADALVGLWPPAHTGKAAMCLKWHACLEGGCLKMTQDEKNELRCAPPHTV